jgi:predicted ArsR family transcriptional regulator
MATEKPKKKTRSALAVEMMKRKTGATAAQIAERFSIAEHSVRALISRIEGETITTSKVPGGKTVYKIDSHPAE